MTLASLISTSILVSSSVRTTSSSGKCFGWSKILVLAGAGSTESLSLVEWSDVTDAVLAQLYNDAERFESGLFKFDATDEIDLVGDAAGVPMADCEPETGGVEDGGGVTGEGKASRGEAGRGEADRGEADRGEASRGEAGRGEADRGEADRGEAGRGEAD